MRRIEPRRLAAVLPLATGAGLLGYLVARASLWLGFGLIAMIGAGLVYAVWRRASPEGRRDLLVRARAGALAGLLATACYDLTRITLVTVFNSPIRPFEAFPAFGGLLLGAEAPLDARLVAGTLFHIANGTLFALAYTLFIRRPRALTGLIWALVLEALMLTLYPTWLDIKAIGEFTQVSMLGHVAYGLSLGGLASRWVPRPRDGGEAA